MRLSRRCIFLCFAWLCCVSGIELATGLSSAVAQSDSPSDEASPADESASPASEETAVEEAPVEDTASVNIDSDAKKDVAPAEQPPAATLEERIQASIAAGDSLAALPLAIQYAEEKGDDVEAWVQVRTFAEWNSKAPEALIALKHIVKLKPDDRDARLALAQRLLWAKDTAAAVPHAQWLMQRDEEKDPVAFEVCTWVFLEQKLQDQAEEALWRWIDAAPKDARPRWIIADLTHWSARWRDAKEQYPYIEALSDQPEKREMREERLRLDHPTEVGAFVTWWTDSIDVEYLTYGAEANIQLPARMVTDVRVERGSWSQDNDNLSGSVGIVRAVARLRVELLDQLTPEVGVGVEVDSEGNRAPVVLAGTRFSFAGKVFGSLHLHYDRLGLSFEGAVEDVRKLGPKLTIYAEPHPWVFVSTEAFYYWFSDDNQHRSALLALGGHNPHDFQVEPRIFGQYNGYKDFLEDSSPYFTPTDPWVYGGDLTLRYTIKDMLKVSATVGGVFQQGAFAVLPSGQAEYLLLGHVRMKARVGYIGSPQYKQLRVDASLSYLF